MTGKACISVTKYYDAKTHRHGLKNRPVLIIGHSDGSDYVALPVSRITHSENIDTSYDFPMEIEDYPDMKLVKKSYVRTHKQFIVNEKDIAKVICNFAAKYSDSYLDILARVDRFHAELMTNALG